MTGSRLLEQHLERVVRYAAMAPSLHNTQPWRFRLDGEALELRADPVRHLPATDPDGRQQLISCGAALLGARLAVRSLGRRERVTLLPNPADPDLLARVVVGDPAPRTPWDDAQLAALPRRRTVRAGFVDGDVDPALRVALCRAAAEQGARLHLLEHVGHRRAVAEAVASADRAQRTHPDVRRELQEWTPGAAEARTDGVPVWAYPTGRQDDAVHALASRDFDDGRRQGLLDVAAAEAQEPLGAVLLTPADTRRDWLSAGAALQAVLLTAAAGGVQASLHSQPIGLGGLRSLIADEVADGGQPQMLLQLGHAVPTPATPRRAPSEVIDVRDALGTSGAPAGSLVPGNGAPDRLH